MQRNEQTKDKEKQLKADILKEKKFAKNELRRIENHLKRLEKQLEKSSDLYEKENLAQQLGIFVNLASILKIIRDEPNEVYSIRQSTIEEFYVEVCKKDLDLLLDKDVLIDKLLEVLEKEKLVITRKDLESRIINLHNGKNQGGKKEIKCPHILPNFIVFMDNLTLESANKIQDLFLEYNIKCNVNNSWILRLIKYAYQSSVN